MQSTEAPSPGLLHYFPIKLTLQQGLSCLQWLHKLLVSLPQPKESSLEMKLLGKQSFLEELSKWF